jgi:hypothetical protein
MYFSLECAISDWPNYRSMCRFMMINESMSWVIIDMQWGFNPMMRRSITFVLSAIAIGNIFVSIKI